jgi:alpha-galactosidase
VPNRQTFPSGIKALADYVHAKGLKLGIYSDAGYASFQIYHNDKLLCTHPEVTYVIISLDELRILSNINYQQI